MPRHADVSATLLMHERDELAAAASSAAAWIGEVRVRDEAPWGTPPPGDPIKTPRSFHFPGAAPMPKVKETPIKFKPKSKESGVLAEQLKQTAPKDVKRVAEELLGGYTRPSKAANMCDRASHPARASLSPAMGLRCVRAMLCRSLAMRARAHARSQALLNSVANKNLAPRRLCSPLCRRRPTRRCSRRPHHHHRRRRLLRVRRRRPSTRSRGSTSSRRLPTCRATASSIPLYKLTS